MAIATSLGIRMRAGLMAPAVLALAGASSGARAQSYDPKYCGGFGGVVFEETEQQAFCNGYNGGTCTGEYYEACREGMRARHGGDEAQPNQAQTDEVQDRRHEVERLPMLAPKGNPLLGRWQRVANVAPPPRSLFEGLAELGNNVACAAIAGDGPYFEFRADALLHGTRTMDSMRYFGGQNGVVVALGERYRPPLAFEFDGPNRAILGSCAFERVGVVATAQAPASTSASAVAATATNKSASGAFSILNVQLGVDSIASVERDIKARGGDPLSRPGDPGNPYAVSTLSGDYQDYGTHVSAVNYFFDASAPAGKLISVMIVIHAFSAPEYDKLLAERKAAASKLVGTLQQKSATEFLAAGAKCQLRLVANPGTFYIRETYELPN
jgi:hypothetical protein